MDHASLRCGKGGSKRIIAEGQLVMLGLALPARGQRPLNDSRDTTPQGQEITVLEVTEDNTPPGPIFKSRFLGSEEGTNTI